MDELSLMSIQLLLYIQAAFASQASFDRMINLLNTGKALKFPNCPQLIEFGMPGSNHKETNKFLKLTSQNNYIAGMPVQVALEKSPSDLAAFYIQAHQVKANQLLPLKGSWINLPFLAEVRSCYHSYDTIIRYNDSMLHTPFTAEWVTSKDAGQIIFTGKLWTEQHIYDLRSDVVHLHTMGTAYSDTEEVADAQEENRRHRRDIDDNETREPYTVENTAAENTEYTVSPTEEVVLYFNMTAESWFYLATICMCYVGMYFTFSLLLV